MLAFSIKSHLQKSLDTVLPILKTAHEISPEFIHNCSPGINTFAKLLSNSASRFIEPMALRAKQITEARFGKIMGLYAPIYLSNECLNDCVYCGFRKSNNFPRTTLSLNEIKKEADILCERGLRHVLLVAGEHTEKCSADFICEVAKILHTRIPSLSIEVAPFSVEQYKKVLEAGVEGVTVYQETYNEKHYRELHPRGKKRDYNWRLETPDRAAEAGIRRINLGVLLGLSKDWKKDSLSTAIHLDYLMKKYWRTKFAVSVPRMCPAKTSFQPAVVVSDKEIVQLILAYRIAFPDLGISLSTREPLKLRDGLCGLAITHLSAASSTEPGGYSQPSSEKEGKQFIISDERSVDDIKQMLINRGLEPVYKDWDFCLN
ncbi:MAG: 2-iminoacetate synthase ThiH [Verrucomicrobiota bacterium]|nr:2-iminoacetate synthase ThiH [Verrucomicrobiota bacterium]